MRERLWAITRDSAKAAAAAVDGTGWRADACAALTGARDAGVVKAMHELKALWAYMTYSASRRSMLHTRTCTIALVRGSSTATTPCQPLTHLPMHAILLGLAIVGSSPPC